MLLDYEKKKFKFQYDNTLSFIKNKRKIRLKKFKFQYDNTLRRL